MGSDYHSEGSQTRRGRFRGREGHQHFAQHRQIGIIGIWREMGLLSNRVERNEIKPGDHIYTYRAVFTYSHHGLLRLSALFSPLSTSKFSSFFPSLICWNVFAMWVTFRFLFLLLFFLKKKRRRLFCLFRRFLSFCCFYIFEA